MAGEEPSEIEMYRQFANSQKDSITGVDEEMRTTPLFTYSVKDVIDKSEESFKARSETNDAVDFQPIFRQYALLGFHKGQHDEIQDEEIILTNVDAPNSTFICGAQGSGKSYTLSCILEGCLIADRRIGRVNLPLAGLAFQYDPDSAQDAAETAHLCSIGVSVNVLVSRSYEAVLRKAYGSLPNAGQYLKVAPLLFRPSDLSIERMHKLMAFTDKENSMPLYMSVVLRILRKMAIETGGESFNYLDFKKALADEKLTKEQSIPLNQRLELLENFMDLSDAGAQTTESSAIELKPGILTVIDLTDPYLNAATACILFDISLSLVKERRLDCGLVVALDEAHKYMTTSLAASNLTEKLLATIREQRHNGTRVLIATQEPTVSEKLLDLCSTSIIHRFNSPAWYTSIRNHLGGASTEKVCSSAESGLFDRITSLNVGESLVFSPSSFLCLTGKDKAGRLGRAAMKMATRRRLGSDGGASVLASGRNGLHKTSGNPMKMVNPPAPPAQNARSTSGKTIIETQNGSARTQIHGAENGGVPLGGDYGNVKKRIVLNKKRSHLMVICCSCEGLAVVEFPEAVLPRFASIVWTDMQGAIGYSICVPCRSQKIELTKKASKQLDNRMWSEFPSDTYNAKEDLHKSLQTILKPILGCYIRVLVRKNDAAYMAMNVIQRTFKEGVVLGVAHLRPEETGGSRPKIMFSIHENGMFFDSALRPED